MANRGVEAYTTDRIVIDAVNKADEQFPADDLSDVQLQEVINRIEGYKDRVGVRALTLRLIEEATGSSPKRTTSRTNSNRSWTASFAR